MRTQVKSQDDPFSFNFRNYFEKSWPETPELTDYKIQTYTIRIRTYSAMCLSVWLIRAQSIFTEKKKMTMNVKIASSGLLKTLLALNILLRI